MKKPNPWAAVWCAITIRLEGAILPYLLNATRLASYVQHAIISGQEAEASAAYESWAKESFEIAAKIAYGSGAPIGSPRNGAMDCAMVAAATVLPVGYVVSARRIADRRMVLAGYQLPDLLTRVLKA